MSPIFELDEVAYVLTGSPGEAGIGVVAIGRNEGERLARCLQSVVNVGRNVVYVDSGSTDRSVATAEQLGVQICRLDMRRPFTAARARNAGICQLAETAPEIDFIQFVDGDCEVASGWLEASRAFLGEHPDVAAVCGRRRERYPGRSVYNQMCDIEWNTPIGEAKACGGDVLIRVLALQQVSGFKEDLIAGEEPELCVRLRAKGWKIWRLDAEMTVHDAEMTRFAQWWNRTARAGYAFAEGAHLHGAPPERHWIRESRSALLWGIAIPVGLLLAAVLVSPRALFGFALYPAQVWRLFLRERGTLSIRVARAAFLVLGRFAEASGQLKFFAHRFSGTRGRLIEYK